MNWESIHLVVLALKIGLIYEGGRPDWPMKDLQREARRLHIALQLIRLSDLFTHFSSEKVEVLQRNRRLDLSDAFIVRGLGWPTNLDRMQHRINLLCLLEEMGKPVMNPPGSITFARDKERSLSILASKGFRVPDTFVSENLSTATRVSRILHRHVIKPLQGSRGLGVVSVESEDLAFHLLRTISQADGVFYQQRLIPNLKMSLRIFTIGREAIGCMCLKAGKGSWKTNVAQNGVPSALKEFEDEAKTAIDAANTLGCWYAGVDLLVGEDGEEFIAEVNSSPSWRVFSCVTGTKPAKRILEFLTEKVRERTA